MSENSPAATAPRQPFPASEIARLIACLSALTEPAPVGVEAWSAEVLALYQGKERRNSRNKMRQALREAAAIAGTGASTSALTPDLVARFAARPGRASTTNGLLASLRVAVKLAAARGYVRADLPALCSFRVRDRDAPRSKHHGREQVKAVLDGLAAAASSWKGGRLHAFASVLAYCGLRRTEALRLKVADVDLEAGFVFVRPNGQALKTDGSEAPVPVPDALASVLSEWIPRCGSEWLIPREDGKGPWVHGRSGCRPGDRLKAAGSAAGVEGFTPRSLRHSLATHLSGFWGLSKGQIRLVLRHTTEATQDIYVHRDLVTLRGLVRGFGYEAAPAPTPASKPARRRMLRPTARRPLRRPWTPPRGVRRSALAQAG